ncbi:hypothetical protein SAMN04487928_10489, partial [Butyrivibrio proteoclasticus]
TNKKLDEISAAASSKLDKMNTSTNKKLDEMNSSTNKKFNEMHSSLNNKLNEMQSSTNNKIDKMGNTTNNKLDAIDKKTGSKLDELGKNTSSKLDAIDRSTNDRISSMGKATNDKLDFMDKSTNSKLDAMDKATNSKLDGMNNTNNNKFNELNASINNSFKNITDASLNNTYDLKSYIAGELNKTNSKLDEVFQRVSDGKKLLASTLLTKGVDVRQDATFKELSDAINRIPQQIILGNGDVSGNVEYEYHYHRDGEGRECDEEYVPENRRGGCYNVPVIHNHTDSCYDFAYRYSYRTRDNCDKLNHVTDRDNGDDPIFRWRCNYCGIEYESDDGYHYESTLDINVFRDRARREIKVDTEKIKKCDYEDGQLIGYRTSCGYVHGQIIKAHISFDQNHRDYNSTVNVPSPRNIMTSHMMVPERKIDIESLFKGFELSTEENASAETSMNESTEGMSGTQENTIAGSTAEKESDEAAESKSAIDLSNSENADFEIPEDISNIAVFKEEEESSLNSSSENNIDSESEKEEVNEASSTESASEQISGDD